jgi:hypothetical protein
MESEISLVVILTVYLEKINLKQIETYRVPSQLDYSKGTKLQNPISYT